MSSNFITTLRQNPNTKRAYMLWSENEDSELMLRATSGMKLEDIAKAHQRTINAIKIRIMSNALKMMKDKKSMTLEEVSKYIYIPIKDLENYQSKIKKEENDKYMTILIEIRDLLKKLYLDYNI